MVATGWWALWIPSFHKSYFITLKHPLSQYHTVIHNWLLIVGFFSREWFQNYYLKKIRFDIALILYDKTRRKKNILLCCTNQDQGMKCLQKQNLMKPDQVNMLQIKLPLLAKICLSFRHHERNINTWPLRVWSHYFNQVRTLDILTIITLKNKKWLASFTWLAKQVGID